jgi:hypothetical protein
MGEIVAIRSLLEGTYSAEDRPPVRLLAKRAVNPRLIRVASLIVISLLSLGLWVAISETVISVASAVR